MAKTRLRGAPSLWLDLIRAFCRDVRPRV